MAEILNLTNIVNNSENLGRSNALLKKTICDYSNKQIYCTTMFGSALFIGITMIIAILIVCFSIPKPSTLCQSKFKAVIDSNSLLHNSYPYSIASGDLNHDNYLDIVVVNSGIDNIGIFLNYGNGTFASQMIFTTGEQSRPLSVALADFNKDSHLDIAVANYDTHNIGIFLGYGNGTFAKQKIFSTGASRPLFITVGDLNNDQWLDIVVANNGTSNIGIFFGYQNGLFGNQITYFTGYDSFPYFILVNDFNTDHYLDVAVVNYGTNTIGILLGYGNGSFTTHASYPTGVQSHPSSIAAHDFNNDGYLDIAVVNSGTNNIEIFLGYGNGRFVIQAMYPVSPDSHPYSIVTGDFNQDNQLDIAVCNYDTDSINIFIGYRNGTFATPTTHSTGIGSSPLRITAADVDNDNKSDIAIANFGTNNILVLIGYSMIHSQSPTSYSTGDSSLPYQIAIGDFDHDTQLDLAVVDYGTSNVGVFFGYGNGSFQEQITYLTGNDSRPCALMISDIDQDGQQDIIVANFNSESLGILYGFNNGSFDTVMTYFTGNFSSPRWISVNDFNNDSYLDIAFADGGTDSIGILLGYGNRTFQNLLTYPSGKGSRPFSIAVGDFNNDGWLDITIANYGINTIGIFLGLGNGTFILFNTYSTGDDSLPSMLTIADLNNDKQLDIIVGNSGTNNVGIFFGNGNGSFRSQQTYSTGWNTCPYWISVADFNNDYWLDLIVANYNTQQVSVLLGNNYENFSTPTTYPVGLGSQPYSIGVGDFNKDNRLDVAVVAYGTNSIAILLGHPTEISINQTVSTTDIKSSLSLPILLGDYYADFLNQTSYSTGSSSKPYSVAIGDLNNDKQLDIIIADSGNESLGLLLGDGNGNFRPEISYYVNIDSSPRHVLVDDFNRDNQSDIAITDPNNDNIIILLGNGTGAFPTKLIYFTGSGSSPNTLAIGNFNKDDYLDLVVANEGTNTIGIFFGFDYTVFTRQQSCESGQDSQPASIAVGDFNNDGHLDIVSALYNRNDVGVFLGYGNGSYTTMMTYSEVPLSHPWSVAVGHFNNDTYLDIVVANWGTNNIGVLLGYGNGNFTVPTLYSTGINSRPVAIAVDDFNNDHYLDITTANYGTNNIGIFLGYGNGLFQTMTTFSTEHGSLPASVTVFDLNNDTYLDVIVANEGNNNIGVFLGYGNGSFAEQMTFSTGDDSTPEYAIAGDFDKDGYLDLATANLGTSNVGILFGCGNGTFSNLQIYDTGAGSNPINLKVGDFNNDNQLDIIFGDENSNNLGIFFGYGDGTFASMSTVSLDQGSIAYAVAIGDFNNDNHLDFAFADDGYNNIGVFLAYGSKPFGGQTIFFIGEDSRPTSVAVGYFNNDNELDVAVTNYGMNNIGILLGYGNRMFPDVIKYSTGSDSHPISLATGYFNNDSLTDIVVANSETNTIAVFLAQDNGSFSSLMTYPLGDESRPVSVAVGDFNRDHQLDIGVANFGTNNVCILFGSGNGTFTNQVWHPLGYNSRPNWIIFKDLNNDNWQDIVVATYGNDNIKILLNLC